MHSTLSVATLYPLCRARACLTEEHYIPSYLSYLGLENETDCRGYLMSAIWNQYGSAHPKSYEAGEINPDLCASLFLSHACSAT